MSFAHFSVLIVDDSADLRRRLRELLRERGITDVREAASAAAGIDAIRASLPDVLLLDVRMPGGPGFDVLRVLDPAGRRPLTIMLTNCIDPLYRSTALALGADHFLDKSYDSELAMDLIVARQRQLAAPEDAS